MGIRNSEGLQLVIDSGDFVVKQIKRDGKQQRCLVPTRAGLDYLSSHVAPKSRK